ncbi:peptide chain release factor N(5)-glutamine methyltransferase [Nitrosospira sp. Is2]|uniref:peptide chain release factor N(5)-glutamine methyltransferase n=1 Tax=Nitrosospira sp. Is2 TaxID=3080532 RepID=UPI00295299C9|nr:peptide chain release factor N(5)-glutamine methyltransferase [Nitrosospira sp. Is2]WON75113.1 peptide chain release factor N(5)-glutamine methyltransferase [Nitrosospira sp. Is2]
MQITIREALDQARRDIDDIDARMLLQHVLDVGHAHLIAHPARRLTARQAQSFRLLVARRVLGEPVAYLIGKREFYSLSFTVTPAVLIPRPETELLVDLSLERIPIDFSCRVLDLGTGSGAVALAIAKHRPLACITAVDISADAVAIAKINAAQLNARNVRIFEGDWFRELGEERFDLIVSNPPYVAQGDPHLGQGDLRYEPDSALAAGRGGLECIESIVACAPAHLAWKGVLLLEHGYDQAQACRELLSKAGLGGVFSLPDFAGIPRVSGGCLEV